jgi:uncharacterized membrane protein
VAVLFYGLSGFFSDATDDLTNLATLKQGPIGLSIGAMAMALGHGRLRAVASAPQWRIAAHSIQHAGQDAGACFAVVQQARAIAVPT